MKVYISGKITGLDLNDARALFAEAAEEVRLMGHEPMNPIELVPFIADWAWEDYMIQDIKILFGCEGIYMMRNWQDSKGARIEHHIALETGKGVMYQGAAMSGRDFAECVRVVRGRYPDAMCMQKQDGLYVVYAEGAMKDVIGGGRTAPRAWNEAANEVEARVMDEKYREEPFVMRVKSEPGELVKVVTGFMLLMLFTLNSVAQNVKVKDGSVKAIIARLNSEWAADRKVRKDVNGTMIDSVVGNEYYVFEYKSLGTGVECMTVPVGGYNDLWVFNNRKVVKVYRSQCKITPLIR